MPWPRHQPVSDRALLGILLVIGLAGLVAGLLAGVALAAWMQTSTDDLVPALVSTAIVGATLVGMPTLMVIVSWRRRRRRKAA